MSSQFAVVAAFTSYALVLAWLLIGIRGYLKTKIIVAAYLVVISTLLVFSFDSYKGYPVDTSLRKGKLVTGYIQEPTPNSPGAIYLVILHDPESKAWWQLFNFTSGEARFYRKPYTKDNQKQMQAALDALANDEEVYLDESEEGKKGASNGQKRRSGEAGSNDGKIEFEVKDRPKLK